MENAVETTIDASGRLVIPKQLRTAANLQQSRDVIVRLVDGVLQIEPRPADINIVRKGSLHVAQLKSKKKHAKLTNETVELVRDALRDDPRMRVHTPA